TWAQIVIPQTSIAVIKGEMVVLKVSYRTDPNHDLSTDTILWNFISNNTQLIISYTKGSMSVSSTQFKGRVGFVSSMPSSDVSLYINNTQESDTGHYLCQIIIPNNPGLTGQVNLDVKVPPAPPRCSLSGKPALKGNVTLSCTSSYGTPVPTYSWKRTSPTSEVFFPPTLSKIFLFFSGSCSRFLSVKGVFFSCHGGVLTLGFCLCREFLVKGVI
ncbi:unnamed protein product, partial [Tetraodon nigroviridis]